MRKFRTLIFFTLIILISTGIALANGRPSIPLATFYVQSIPLALLAIVILNHRINWFNLILFVLMAWNPVVIRSPGFLYFIILTYLGWFVLAWRASKYGEHTIFNVMFIWILSYLFVFQHFMNPVGFLYISVLVVAGWLYYEYYINEKEKIVFDGESVSNKKPGQNEEKIFGNSNKSRYLRQFCPAANGYGTSCTNKISHPVKSRYKSHNSRYFDPFRSNENMLLPPVQQSSNKKTLRQFFSNIIFDFSFFRRILALILGLYFITACCLTISSEEYVYIYMERSRMMSMMRSLVYQADGIREKNEGKLFPTVQEFAKNSGADEQVKKRQGIWKHPV